MLDVKGMMCGGCSAAVKGMLVKQPGVEAAAVNLLTETAAVTVKVGDAAQVTAAAEFLTKKVGIAVMNTSDLAACSVANGLRMSLDPSSCIELAVACYWQFGTVL